MSMKLTEADVAEIRKRYYYLTNYNSEDLDQPIDPLAYKDPNGDYLLHIAAERNDVETAKLLLKACFDVNQLGDMGNTALHYARYQKNEEMADLLLSHGASINIRDDFGHL